MEEVKSISAEELASRLGVSPPSIMRDLAELEAKELLKTSRERVYYVTLTSEGRRYVIKGFPEYRLLRKLANVGTIPVRNVFQHPENYDLERGEVSIALSNIVKLNIVKIEAGKLVLKGDPSEALKKLESTKEELKKLENTVIKDLKSVELFKRRRLVNVKERSRVYVKITPETIKLLEKGLVKAGIVVTRLTPELIETGKWREAIFKKYDLGIEVPTVYPARKHPYMELLDQIREVLEAMGFIEMKGPHVELEFWNFDTLFQAQDHPAREIHDTFFVKSKMPGRVGDEELIERIRRTHEDGWITGSRGWGYKWSLEKALSLILRTQTTAVSMRTIYKRGEGEYRYFALDRVFRPETLDPTHSMEFYQLEGIIVGRKVTFRTLLWFFNEFAKIMGLGKVKIKPAYFPFTEPSVEGFIKHPKLGWIEVFPGGMFRPEVLYPLGVKECNVAAWGIGIDRIAMTILEIDDIRDLFSPDIAFLKSRKVPFLKNLLRV